MGGGGGAGRGIRSLEASLVVSVNEVLGPVPAGRVGRATSSLELESARPPGVIPALRRTPAARPGPSEVSPLIKQTWAVRLQ